MSSELIAHLSAGLRPVRRLPGAATRTALWTGSALGLVALGVHSGGARPDALVKLSQASFLTEEFSLLTVSALAARSAFRLSVPGLGDRAARWLPLVALGAWVALIVARGGAGIHPSLTPLCWRCGARMMVLMLVPALVSLAMLRRAVPLAPCWSGFFALLSATALGMLGTQLMCVKDDPSHLLVFHVVPVAVVATLGAWSGPRWLLSRWRP